MRRWGNTHAMEREVVGLMIFVFPGGSVGCHQDNLWCRLGRRVWVFCFCLFLYMCVCFSRDRLTRIMGSTPCMDVYMYKDVWWYIFMYVWASPHLYIFLIELETLSAWRRHQMETFSALLALWEGSPLVTGGLPSQRPAAWSFEIFSRICTSAHSWANNQDAGDSRHHQAH